MSETMKILIKSNEPIQIGLHLFQKHCPTKQPLLSWIMTD